MIVLIGFALLAGAGTALSPCVLPVLPAILSASSAGGRRRPLGIVLGLAVTFTVTIVGAAKVADGVGLGAGALRWAAIVVLGAFGIAVAIPALSSRLEAPLAPLSRLGPRGRGDGFRSGLLVGGALGFLYTPCAGPILAAVIAASAASGRVVSVAIAYALGSALVLLALALGGRRIVERVHAAGRGATVQRALGVVMIATAVAMAAQLDVRLDQAIAQNIPDVSLTASLERSHAVLRRLNDLRGHPSRFAVTIANPGATAASSLPHLGVAPEFADTQRWFNSPPLTMAALRRRVVLIDFWTYTCINCIRTLPYLEAWDARYRAAGLTIIGVHSPEFSFEHDAGNVGDAIARFGIHYPVVQDNNLSVWQSYGNQYWPADYLIDATGQVRFNAFGEGDYGRTESAIRALLAESGHPAAGGMAQPRGAITPSSQTTPETYWGIARAAGFVPSAPVSGTHTYAGHPAPLPLSSFAYGGSWTIGDEQASAGAGATLDAEVQAKNVYAVLGPPASGAGSVQVLLDGRAVGPGTAGSDVHAGQVLVPRQRLYSLISLPSDSRHRLTLRLSPGTSGYSFTFG